MKAYRPLIFAVLSASLMFAGTAMAQTQPMAQPNPPDPQTMPPPAPPSPADQQNMAPPPSAPMPDNTTMRSPMGDSATIHSTMGPPAPMPPPPAFSDLSGGKSWITPAQAASYPPLANDFGYADSNHDGHISKAEYARWLKQAD